MGATPDQLRGEVEARRAHLAHHVDLLADRMAPRRVARRRIDASRRRLTDMKEQVMGTANDTAHGTRDLAERAGDTAGQLAHRVGDTAGQLGQRIGDTAGQASDAVQHTPARVRRQTRGNPLAAGIIAFGAGMLAGTLLPVSQAEQRAGAHLREHADDLVEPLKQAAGTAAQEIKEEMTEPARDAVESVKSTAQDALDTTKDTGRQAARTTAEEVKQTGQDAAREIRDQAGT
ncbi:DUF3618 domain-containing protein [Kitasatospora terrestris]|uniref:DUF3618 domain-containing protein n=1 Tax=Kitasatospora terrestris TaxID=258051 RepID=A0ABP9EH24_9ACTN